MYSTAVHAWHIKEMPKIIAEGSVTAPSPLMIERGKAFGAWFREALSRSGKNIKTIADEIGVSRQMLYAFRDDCIGSDHRYRKPSEGMILKIAHGLNAVASDGLKCMGYSVVNATTVPDSIANLPQDIQHALANTVQKIFDSQIERIREEYEDYSDLEPEFVTLFTGLSTKSKADIFAEVRRRAEQEEREKSIGGGVASGERKKRES